MVWLGQREAAQRLSHFTSLTLRGKVLLWRNVECKQKKQMGTLTNNTFDSVWFDCQSEPAQNLSYDAGLSKEHIYSKIVSFSNVLMF